LENKKNSSVIQNGGFAGHIKAVKEMFAKKYKTYTYEPLTNLKHDLDNPYTAKEYKAVVTACKNASSVMQINNRLEDMIEDIGFKMSEAFWKYAVKSEKDDMDLVSYITGIQQFAFSILFAAYILSNKGLYSPLLLKST
jgi:hypothetical protein